MTRMTSEADTSTDSPLVLTDGFAADLGDTPDGRCLAALVRRDVDTDFREEAAAIWNAPADKLRPGRTLGDWLEAKSAAVSKVVLLREGQSPGEATVLAEGRCLDGPAMPLTAAQPIVAWTEPAGDRWRLRVYDGGHVRTAIESDTSLGRPTIAATGDGWVAAAQRYDDSAPAVVLCDSSGAITHEFPAARNPHLVGTGGDWCLVHESISPSGTRLSTVVSRAGECTTGDVPAADDLNLHPRLAITESELYLVHEACPMWGFDEQFGRHREICLWHFDNDASAWRPAAHTCNSHLAIPFWATREVTDKNFPPIQPDVRVVNGEPTVFFRRFRQHGGKAYGWDIMQLRRSADGWHPPQRISEHYGHPEVGMGVLADASGGLLAMVCCEQLPLTRYEPGLEGPSDCVTGCEQAQSNHPGRPHHNRIEVTRWAHNAPAENACVIPGTRGRYCISPAIPDLAPEPPHFDVPGKILVWGDLHVHTAYSKCAAANDGTPEENLRFQRDHLGCRVLCLTEHGHIMSHAEHEHSFDVLQREAGKDAVALYASEPLTTGQDTIFYSLDRQVIARFHALSQVTRNRGGHYQMIKQHLPPRSLIVARHFHPGDERRKGQPSSELIGFDPELEPFMEAQQTRGDNLRLDDVLGPRTVRHFLQAGCKLGLTGGSDHAMGHGPDHVALTGFWLDELTPEAVWDALWHRRTFSVNNAKIALWATLNDAVLGDTVETSLPLRFRVNATCPFPLTRLTLTRDGKIIAESTFDDTTGECELIDDDAHPGPHWYVVSAEARSRFMHQNAVAHLSPFFVTVT